MHDMNKVLERETFAPGTYIFREGQQGRRAYVIQEGEVEILRENGVTPERLAVIGKGSIFGEMALIDNAPRMASAKAVSMTVAVAISRDMLNDRLKKSDPLIAGLVRIFAQNIRSLSERMDRQSSVDSATEYVRPEDSDARTAEASGESQGDKSTA